MEATLHSVNLPYNFTFPIFIFRNLDLILIQSRPSDLDGIIEDYSYSRVVEDLKESYDRSCHKQSPSASLSSSPTHDRQSAHRVAGKERSGSIEDMDFGSSFLHDRRYPLPPSFDRRDRSGSSGSIVGSASDLLNNNLNSKQYDKITVSSFGHLQPLCNQARK